MLRNFAIRRVKNSFTSMLINFLPRAAQTCQSAEHLSELLMESIAV